MEEEIKKQFEEADKKFDKIMEENKKKALNTKKEGYSKVNVKPKTFMKISDVDTEDAVFFKNWCDEHTEGKQFLGIKVMRAILERIDPIVKNVLTQVNSLTARLDSIESYLNQPKEEEPKLVIPKTQGSAKRGEQK